MEKFIRIESIIINVNTITDIHPNVFDDTECIIIDTNDGAKYIKPLPKHIDTIDDVAGAYLDLITSFLASKEPDELVLDLNTYDGEVSNYAAHLCQDCFNDKCMPKEVELTIVPFNKNNAKKESESNDRN